MDYLEHVDLRRHISWSAFEQARKADKARLVLLTTKASVSHTAFRFQPRDIILVGRESAGVPQDVHDGVDSRIIIPMRPELRSLNVVVSAAIALGEALRQLNAFPS